MGSGVKMMLTLVILLVGGATSEAVKYPARPTPEYLDMEDQIKAVFDKVANIRPKLLPRPTTTTTRRPSTTVTTTTTTTRPPPTTASAVFPWLDQTRNRSANVYPFDSFPFNPAPGIEPYPGQKQDEEGELPEKFEVLDAEGKQILSGADDSWRHFSFTFNRPTTSTPSTSTTTTSTTTSKRSWTTQWTARPTSAYMTYAERTSEGPRYPDPDVSVVPAVGDSLPPLAEPTPEFSTILEELGQAWDVHVYVFGASFAFLGLYCVASIFRVNSLPRLLSKGYFLTLLCLVLILCVTRSVGMLYDAYNIQRKLHPILGFVVFNTAFPCLTSAFSVLFLALLKASRTKLLTPYVQNPATLAGLIVLHFLLSISTDIVLGTQLNGNLLLLVCQVVFIAWAMGLSFGYFYIFGTLYKAALRSQSDTARDVYLKLHGVDTSALSRRLPKPTLSLAVKITLFTAIVGVFVVGVVLYGMLHVFGVQYDRIPDAWPWWIYHILLRTLELTMCCLIVFVATQPLRKWEIEQRAAGSAPCGGIFCMAPCGSTWQSDRKATAGSFHTNQSDTETCGQEEMYPPFVGTNYAVRKYELHTGKRVYNDTFPAGNLTHCKAPAEGQCFAISMAPKKRQWTAGSMNARRSVTSTLLSTASENKVLASLKTDVMSQNSCSCSRPASMLYSDGGFIRFRHTTDPQELPNGSIPEPEDFLAPYAELTRGEESSVYQLPVDQGTEYGVERIYQTCGHPYAALTNTPTKICTSVAVQTSQPGPGMPMVKRRYRADTTDVSSNDALSSKGNNSAGDVRFSKHASTCSSESAAQSFDVRMYYSGRRGLRSKSIRSRDFSTGTWQSDLSLAQSDNHPPTNFAFTSRSDVNLDCLTDGTNSHHHFNGEFSDSDIFSSVDMNGCEADDETDAFSFSYNPMFNLNLKNLDFAAMFRDVSKSEDVTPDSAVVADITQQQRPFRMGMPSTQARPDQSQASVTSSVSDFLKLNTRSLNDLFKMSPGQKPKWKSKGFLGRLRGSNPALNYDYTPLDCEDGENSLRRSSSDNRVAPEEVVAGRSEDARPLLTSRDEGGRQYRFFLDSSISEGGVVIKQRLRRHVSQSDSTTQTDFPDGGASSRQSSQFSSMDWVDSLGVRGEDEDEECGESDVNVNPDLLKARILNVCSEIGELSRPALPLEDSAI